MAEPKERGLPEKAAVNKTETTHTVTANLIYRVSHFSLSSDEEVVSVFGGLGK